MPSNAGPAWPHARRARACCSNWGRWGRAFGYSCKAVGGSALKVQERELSWLTTEQIVELLEEIWRGCGNPYVEIIALTCLATDARWSEAEKLKPTGLRNGVITFSGTKNGKVRSVPITAELEAKIVKHWKQHGQPNSAIIPIRRALARTTIRLPKGQASHALRHTFASHFMQKGGNILTLQKILGHSSLAITMRYAHLAPEHLAEAVRLNPLASVRGYALES
ncbi:tyrosine-type recombinase/integrase [Pseudomonas sp. GOM7]|uniref:tyrosine-type recombinase/integrase n=1 Tax=unclassified Pseudomonas TaxID=196821 RepID=UPI00227C928F|nr:MULTISPECIES: tyrosine-type recombinase/integrase [unclassified Pseudomonas]WAJ38718.1 tyrosine-type recombinase/integrase [Pseudomonas sp. GOM7]